MKPKSCMFFFILMIVGLPVPAYSLSHHPLCRIGDSAVVFWQGKWRQAEVVDASVKGIECKVHYKGYDKKWDEWVGKDRIRILSAKEQAPQRTYLLGERVQVLWGDKWWNAHILKRKGEMYYINYDGYTSRWNEWVGLDRIRPLSSSSGFPVKK